MKKFLKVLAAVAAVAAVVPYKAKADENGGELEGLLWKANWKLDPDYQSDPDINVTFGFNNPFESLKESHLFADDLVVDYCCDGSLTPPPAHDFDCCDESEDFADDDCCCGDECTCGDNCTCGDDDCTCKE